MVSYQDYTEMHGQQNIQIWSLLFKEEHVLIVFDNRELRNTFGSKKEDVKGTGEDALHNISIIRGIKFRIKRTEYVARLVQITDANRFFFVRKHEG